MRIKISIISRYFKRSRVIRINDSKNVLFVIKWAETYFFLFSFLFYELCEGKSWDVLFMRKSKITNIIQKCRAHIKLNGGGNDITWNLSIFIKVSLNKTGRCTYRLQWGRETIFLDKIGTFQFESDERDRIPSPHHVVARTNHTKVSCFIMAY